MSKKPSKTQTRTEDEGNQEIEISLNKAEVVEENGGFQTTSDEKVDRRLHCWYRRRDGSYKCVLCGGVSDRPTYNRLPDKVEKLTDEEREMRQPEHRRGRRQSSQDRRRDDEDCQEERNHD